MIEKSLKILAHLKDKSMPVSVQYLENRFGIDTSKYIQELIDLSYIEETTQKRYSRSYSSERFYHDAPCGLYRITGSGRAHLNNRLKTHIDSWITRIAAIIGAVTGVASLLIEIIFHFA